MKDCIFCKMIKGEVPSYKVWENENFIAIIDKFPKIKGQTLIISREHLSSDILELPQGKIRDFFSAAKHVARLMKKGFKVERVSQLAEGLEVPHAHIKLFPVYNLIAYGESMGGAKYQLEDKDMAEFAAMIKKGGE